MIVPVIRAPVKKVDVSAWNTSSGSIEAIVDTHLQPAYVEIVKVTVQSGISIAWFQVPVFILFEFHAKEVSDVSKYYEDEIGDVRCQEKPVRRLIEDRFRKVTALMSAGVTMCRRVERSELCILPY